MDTIYIAMGSNHYESDCPLYFFDDEKSAQDFVAQCEEHKKSEPKSRYHDTVERDKVASDHVYRAAFLAWHNRLPAGRDFDSYWVCELGRKAGKL